MHCIVSLWLRTDTDDAPCSCVKSNSKKCKVNYCTALSSQSDSLANAVNFIVNAVLPLWWFIVVAVAVAVPMKMPCFLHDAFA